MTVDVRAQSSRTISTRLRSDLITHLPQLRRVLLEQRQFRIDQVRELVDEAATTAVAIGAGEPEPVDASADSARTEVSMVIAAAARRALDDIEAALDRIAGGTFGYCEDCDDPIPLDRILALPQAGMCMKCQRRAERR